MTMSSDAARTCPNCGRLVEPGFKFCDGCGTRLDESWPPIAPSAVEQPPRVAPPPPERPAPPPPPPVELPSDSSDERKSIFERRRERKAEDARVDTDEPAETDEQPKPERQPLVERWRRRREAAQAEEDEPEPGAQSEAPATMEMSTETPVERKPSLFERRRQRKAEQAADEADVAPALPHTSPETSATDTSDTAQSRASAATSKPVTAEELRGARPAIGGRLRWADEETRGIERGGVSERARTEVAGIRPVDDERDGLDARWVTIFVLHLLLAMVVGAVLVGATAAIASLISNGSVALLEIRGLPIFIGGATAVMLFTLLRTGKRAPDAERRSVIVSVVLGFIILVVASTLLFQPRVIENVQGDLERALRVYGQDETQAVNDFIGDISSWNTETTRYRDEVVGPFLRGESNIDEFRFNAAGTEETLKGVVNSMNTHADGADNERLSDALGDLAAIYQERLSAILLITRGLVSNDQALVNSGETRRDASKARAVEFFDQRVRPLLERADIDPDSFANAVAGGY